MQAPLTRRVIAPIALGLVVALTGGCGPASSHPVHRAADQALPPLPAAVSVSHAPTPKGTAAAVAQAARRQVRSDAAAALGVARMVDRRWARDQFGKARGRSTRAKLYGRVLAALRYAEHAVTDAEAAAARVRRLTPLQAPLQGLDTALARLDADLVAGTPAVADVRGLSTAAAALVTAGRTVRLRLSPGRVPQLSAVTVTMPPDQAALRARAARVAARRAVRLDTGVAWGVVRRYLEHTVARGTFAPTKAAGTLSRARARLLRALTYEQGQLAAARRACAPQPKLREVCSAVAAASATVAALMTRVRGGQNPTSADSSRVEAAFVAIARRAAAVRLRVIPRRAPTIA